MNTPKKENKKGLRKRIVRTDVPVLVYIAVIIAMASLWAIGLQYELAQEFFIELFGVAFTLFIIDVLLVRTRTKRWKVVQEDVDYLIARGISRLRDGLSFRAFNFDPDVESQVTIREQQAQFLLELEDIEIVQIESKLYDSELFTAASYAYFNERAQDVWEVVNMKYSEYLSPELISKLINLHTYLKDTCSYINQYRKSERFVEDKDYYQQQAKSGISHSIKNVIHLINDLKKEGYSEPARLEILPI